jgi:hypothetical protein
MINLDGMRLRPILHVRMASLVQAMADNSMETASRREISSTWYTFPPESGSEAAYDEPSEFRVQGPTEIALAARFVTDADAEAANDMAVVRRRRLIELGRDMLVAIAVGVSAGGARRDETSDGVRRLYGQRQMAPEFRPRRIAGDIGVFAERSREEA